MCVLLTYIAVISTFVIKEVNLYSWCVSQIIFQTQIFSWIYLQWFVSLIENPINSTLTSLLNMELLNRFLHNFFSLSRKQLLLEKCIRRIFLIVTSFDVYSIIYKPHLSWNIFNQNVSYFITQVFSPSSFLMTKFH